MKKSLYIASALIMILILSTGCTSTQKPIQDINDEPTSSPNAPSVSNPSKPSENLPAAPDSVNSDNYWVSDTEFDIVGFCEAHGLEKNKIIEPAHGEPIIRLYHNEWLGDKITKVVEIQLGDGYFIVVTFNDYANLQAVMFNGNNTLQSHSEDRVAFTGTEITMYADMMDFVIYVIPRMLNDSIDDPMQGFGYTHTISRATIENTDTGRVISYGNEGETVND